MRKEDRALYIISVAAELAGVHPQTLRIYERKGLIEPQRTAGGSRRYSEREVALLRRIQELTALGMSLEGAKYVLDLEEQLAEQQSRVEELQQSLARARRETREAVERIHRQYRRDLVPVRRGIVVTKPVGKSRKGGS